VASLGCELCGVRCCAVRTGKVSDEASAGASLGFYGGRFLQWQGLSRFLSSTAPLSRSVCVLHVEIPAQYFYYKLCKVCVRVHHKAERVVLLTAKQRLQLVMNFEACSVAVRPATCET
jgi:hypothetical protein